MNKNYILIIILFSNFIFNTSSHASIDTTKLYIPQIKAVIEGKSKDEIFSSVTQLKNTGHTIAISRYKDLINAHGAVRKDLAGKPSKSYLRVLFDRNDKVKDLTMGRALLQPSMQGCDEAYRLYGNEILKLSNFTSIKSSSGRIEKLYNNNTILNFYYGPSECSVSVTIYTGDYASAHLKALPAHNNTTAAKEQGSPTAEKIPLNKKNVVLYQGKGIRVVTDDQGFSNFCGTYNLFKIKVFYDGKVANRDQLFGGDYAKFATKNIMPSILEKCNQNIRERYAAHNNAPLLSYSKFEKIHMAMHDKNTPDKAQDMYVYDVYPSGKLSQSNYFIVAADAYKGRSKEEIRAAKMKRKEKGHDAWGGNCSGPFCNHSGGLYLNAIYKNDAHLIRSLDKRLERRINRQLEGALFGQTLNRKAKNTISLLPLIADMYLYHYNADCLKSGAKSMTFRYKESDTRWENAYGTHMGTDRGKTHKSHYRVNPEFYSLLQKVGHHNGDLQRKMISQSVGIHGPGYTFNGVGQIVERGRYECEDPIIKKFEKNLITLTNEHLKK